MRNETGLGIMAAGLIAMVCFLGPSCGSGNQTSLDPIGPPDGAVSSGGDGGSTGRGGTDAASTAVNSGASGGTTGLGGTGGASTATVPFFHPQPDGGPQPAKEDASARPDAGSVLYGLTPDSSCFRITGLSDRDDGCQLGVDAIVGLSLPATYDATTGVLTLGASGSLGAGPIRYNQGTLVRAKSRVEEPGLSECGWNQEDTSTLTMTGENRFTISVVENQDSITPACGATFSSCTSTWTWTMQIDKTSNPPGCY